MTAEAVSMAEGDTWQVVKDGAMQTAQRAKAHAFYSWQGEEEGEEQEVDAAVSETPLWIY